MVVELLLEIELAAAFGANVLLRTKHRQRRNRRQNARQQQLQNEEVSHQYSPGNGHGQSQLLAIVLKIAARESRKQDALAMAAAVEASGVESRKKAAAAA